MARRAAVAKAQARRNPDVLTFTPRVAWNDAEARLEVMALADRRGNVSRIRYRHPELERLRAILAEDVRRRTAAATAT